jgi:predicted nucleic acid-binding Zn ribbon protein
LFLFVRIVKTNENPHNHHDTISCGMKNHMEDESICNKKQKEIIQENQKTIKCPDVRYAAFVLGILIFI